MHRTFQLRPFSFGRHCIWVIYAKTNQKHRSHFSRSKDQLLQYYEWYLISKLLIWITTGCHLYDQMKCKFQDFIGVPSNRLWVSSVWLLKQYFDHISPFQKDNRFAKDCCWCLIILRQKLFQKYLKELTSFLLPNRPTNFQLHQWFKQVYQTWQLLQLNFSLLWCLMSLY